MYGIDNLIVCMQLCKNEGNNENEVSLLLYSHIITTIFVVDKYISAVILKILKRNTEQKKTPFILDFY